MMKQILCIQTQAAYSNLANQEQLDLPILLASFDNQVSMAFIDEGIWQLAKHQQADLIQQKNKAQQLQALSAFDVEKVYVTDDTLQRFSLSIDDLVISVIVVTQAELSELIQTQDWVVSF